jgi:hypothetical protein
MVSNARIGDNKVFEARIAGALSLNSFSEILDSVIFGRRLSARFVVHGTRLARALDPDDRSQLQTSLASFGAESVTPSRVCAKQRALECQDARARNQDFLEGVPTQRVVVAKVDRRCRVGRVMSLLTPRQTDPKRETAPGEATSGVGSRWQNREIDTNR